MATRRALVAFSWLRFRWIRGSSAGRVAREMENRSQATGPQYAVRRFLSILQHISGHPAQETATAAALVGLCRPRVRRKAFRPPFAARGKAGEENKK